MIWRILLIWLSLLSCVFGNFTRTGTFTVTGATPAPAASVTVNGATAQTNGDFTFAAANNTLANGNNTFTIIAQNVYGTKVTNSLTANLPTSVNFQYDLNGSLTSDGTRTFNYDGENQLTNVSVAGAYQVSFVYDGLNRRRIERDYNWQGGAWVKTNEARFLYDGMQAVQERDSNNDVQVTYTRGLDLSATLSGAGGIGGLLARTDGNGSTYYHADGNGNITMMLDGSQNLAARAEYDGYGRFLKLSGPYASLNRFWFSSQEFIASPGIYGYWGRFYDPTPGRLLQRDPIGEWGGINLYGFVGNNPVNQIDPLGLWSLGEWWHNFWNFHGGTDGVHAQYSQMSMLNAEESGTTPLTENGNRVTPSQVLGQMGGSAAAGMMMFPLGEAEGAYAAADAALKAAEAAKAAKAAKCFKSFNALKRAIPNTPGNVWHHVVEQSQEGRFGAAAIQNANNVFEVPPEVNQSLNALYSSIRPDITGSDTQTVRQWLSSQTIDQATAFGQKAVQNVTSGTWP